MIDDKPYISVIVPVYNTEYFLPKCINSIVDQSYTNLEIIIVDDASPGNVKKIAHDYMAKDSRIKFIQHDVNKGLFHARITGSELATGEYIAFVDSDDHITVDFYRLLINKALEEDADIVEGRIIRELENGNKFIQNHNNILFETLIEEKIREEFFSQEGRFYHWHVIWNKLYRKELWDKCLPYYKRQTKHLIMTEDVVFSSLLFCNAQKYCSIKYDGYFYYVRAEASTGSSSDLNKYIKNITDMGTAFDFVTQYLHENNFKETYSINLNRWKESYYRLWASRLTTSDLSYLERNKAITLLQDTLHFSEIEVSYEDHYHSLIDTAWNPKYEQLKNWIASEEIECVSFDIFDTLVVRPFFEPRDLYLLLDEYFHQIVEDKLVEFSTIRFQAEDRARQLIRINQPSWQDISLDEIYDLIKNEYNLPDEVVDKLKHKEIELELQFTNRRESVYQLYQFALELNKKVIFVSDMYLSTKVIINILKKSGYTTYDKLYVSSETRMLKHTGDMYKHVLLDFDMDAKRILHIGDNWNSDKVMANKHGINAHHIPKTIDLLINQSDELKSGNSMKFIDAYRDGKWNVFEFNEHFATRSMLAVVANKLFDNPHPTFNSNTDFNADPYTIGYYALGMHTFGLCKWLLEDSVNEKHSAIHFLARDGYLPLQVYNTISKYYEEAPKSSYLYASRRSLLPFMLMSQNVYGIESFFSIWAHTPSTILELFGFLLKDKLELELFENEGVLFTKRFSSDYEFKCFMDLLLQYGIDSSKLDEYLRDLEQYFKEKIGSNEAIFDLGYSARLQTIIVSLLNQSCDAYFVHTSKETPWLHARRSNFKLKSFYGLKPNISGILREHFFAELGPSCIGYKKKDNTEDIIPIFENYVPSSINDLMIRRMQQGATEFAEEMMQTFHEYKDVLHIRNEEVSLPLELYIHNSKQGDRSIFKYSYSDDQVHGGNDRNSILDWWSLEINKVHNHASYVNAGNMSGSNALVGQIYNRNRVVKLTYYTLFDRDGLKVKVKNKLASKPLMLSMITIPYKYLRKIKRILVK